MGTANISYNVWLPYKQKTQVDNSSLALALIFPGRVASVFTSVSVISIIDTDPELRQTAKRPGKPGFHARFNTPIPMKN